MKSDAGVSVHVGPTASMETVLESKFKTSILPKLTLPFLSPLLLWHTLLGFPSCSCKSLSLSICKNIYCRENRYLRCKVDNYKCVCPSCDGTRHPVTCRRTKCLEQRHKPRCDYNTKTRKCLCPQCSFRTNKRSCISTRCPDGRTKCK